MITGESEPVDSSVVAADPNALEARNIIFSGSLVVDGASLAVVIRTGKVNYIYEYIYIYIRIVSFINHYSIVM